MRSSHSYRSRGGYSLKETHQGRLAYTRNTAEVAHFQIVANSERTFRRVFREHAGCSPSHYKKRSMHEKVGTDEAATSV